jgi:hypothetical protein
MILHGLRSLGHEVVDYPKAWYMYKSLKEKHWNNLIPNEGKAYGRGFTVAGTFDVDPIVGKVDRNNIEDKIKNHHFDLIIYGSSRRNLLFLEEVKNNYNKDKIIFIDGEDDADINWNLLKVGHYFKRELIYENEIFPIGFCIPKEKIFNGKTEKSLQFAKMRPDRKSTYIYENEEDYYIGYRIAKFGVTMKKGGWDCMRHYEIMANKCLPNFINIEGCPKNTMTFFPKEICKEINQDIRNNTMYDEKYEEYINTIYDYLNKYLTTDKMAKYMLEKIL